jgi:hypothetical protein
MDLRDAHPMTSIRRFGWTALVLIALVGCDSSQPPASTTAPSAAELKKEADAAKLSDAELAEIKKLPEAEQRIATAQISCPVSDGHLGEMGTPIKQTIGDKTFFLCCESCVAKVKSDPQGVLAKLKK